MDAPAVAYVKSFPVPIGLSSSVGLLFLGEALSLCDFLTLHVCFNMLINGNSVNV